jgi:ADP-ribose pyrophosphatase YjhB (NUDIX family)
LPSYIEALRALTGPRPLILAGTNVYILDESRRLVMMRRVDTGGWWVPGGFMEPGETFEETARRETLEETGIALGNLDFLRVFSGPECYYRYPNGDEVYSIIAAYAANVTNDARAALRSHSDEAAELAFVAFDDQRVRDMRAQWSVAEECLRLIEHR